MAQMKTDRSFILTLRILLKVGNDTCIYIGGDFNIAQNQYLDTCNYCHINNPKAKECLLNIKEDLNLV